MISLKDLKDQTELVVVVTQLYNRKIVCREDIALPAQREVSTILRKKRSINTEILRHLVRFYKFARIDRS